MNRWVNSKYPRIGQKIAWIKGEPSESLWMDQFIDSSRVENGLTQKKKKGKGKTQENATN